MTALSHFSTSYTAHGMLFLSFQTSLSPLASSRPICLFLGPMIHYSGRLGLMVLLFALPILCCPCYWAFLLSTWILTNGPQHRVASVTVSSPWKYLVQNTSTMSSQVKINSGFRPMYQVYARSHSDFENSRRHKSSSVA